MTAPEAGNGPDWSGIFEEHAAALLGRSRRVLGPEPHALTGVSADDTLQETFARAMNSLRYQGSYREIRSYLQRQLGWVLSDAFEEQSRRQGNKEPKEQSRREGTKEQSRRQESGHLSLEELPPDQATGSDPIGDVVDRLDDEQILRISTEHLRCLTPNERRVWEEHLRKGRRAAEVAVELGVTSTRVRQLARAAGRKLRGCVADPDHP
jgi:RNA polymerase sigma factor (sigma-70 family)